CRRRFPSRRRWSSCRRRCCRTPREEPPRPPRTEVHRVSFRRGVYLRAARPPLDRGKPTTMRILTPKDGGKIQLLRLGDETARLAVRADERNSDFRQYFSFVARDLRRPCTFEITNAADCTYGDAFEGYRVCASVVRSERGRDADADDDDWFRVETELDEGTLRFSYEPKRGEDAVRFAYFAPYTRARRRGLAERLRKSRRVRASSVGKSVRGEPMELFTFGSKDDDAPKLWIIGQQHPGETMAGWFMEGAASRLAFGDDPVAEELLERARLFLVLCMNPDG